MKLVTTNQDLIVGRKYLCRTKPIKAQNGSFSKPEISILEVGEREGRRYVGAGKFWAYDERDGIISWNGNQRLEAEAKTMKLPVSEISVILEDYEVNSQALERWDMIGPIPEIKEEILHVLFDYPELLFVFDRPISLHPDGNIAVLIDPQDDEWHLLTDKEDAEEIFGILNLQRVDFSKLVESCVEAPAVWEGQSLSDIDSFVSNVDVADEHRFVTTESCGSKIGKRIRLYEKKHNQFGYYNEGGIITIHGHISDVGYTAGIPDPNNRNTTLNIVTVGYDGFEFVD